MAIIRVRGGNSGIAEYLRDGQKQGRAFNRDELDMRVCLDGNLSLTDSIINSIPDKSQDRYLHITISFRESEVSIETLEAVTQDYKKLFLSSYKDDEVNFYAEAHLPKIKTITDRNTGEEKERKPHIHIVIPKQNLLTGGSLDPVGLYKHHEKFHEAIQENLNQKYNLESPKDFVRLTDDHQAQILSRVKADTFKGFRSEVKKEIFGLIEKENISSYANFIKSLEGKYSEVRIRNKGKENEYVAIKTSPSENYINLKSPLFQRKYIEERKVEKVKPTIKQVERLLDDWKYRVSKEIKYINKSSKKVQVAYKAASFDDKKEIILNRERGFYESARRYTDSGQTSKKHGSQNRKRGHLADIATGLPEMRSGELVPNLNGYQYSDRERQFNASLAGEGSVLVRKVQSSSVADRQQEQSEHNGLRWSTRNTDRVIESVVNTISFNNQEREKASKDSELAEFKNIRLVLKADHLLNRLSNTHGINPADYDIRTAKDGSARINCGNVNLNVSDFLTKEMKFTWNEAKTYLRAAYDEQISNEISNAKIKLPKEAWQSFNSEFRPNYFGKIKELRGELNYNCKVMRFESKQAYWSERKDIFSRKMSYTERKAALSVAVFNKLKHDKEIRQYQYQERKQLSKFENVDTEFLILNYVQNNEGGNMGKLSDMIGNVSEKNTFSPFEPEYGVNLKRHVSEIQQNEEFNAKNKKRLELNDLSPSKQNNGDVKYKTSLLGTAFVDKGDKIEFPTLINDKEKIALGLELAAEKYKGKIQLTGLPGFKDKAIEIAAERGLEVEFRPKKYQERFEELKQQYAQERAEKGLQPEHSRAAATGRDKQTNAEPELAMSGFKSRDLQFNELSRDGIKDISKTLSENHISFVELSEASKASPNKAVGQLIDEIIAKPESERAATGQELHVTSAYDADSNRTRLLVNDLPMDIYIQTAAEIYQTDPETVRMPLIANDDLSQFTTQQIEQGFAEGEVNVPAITVNENGRSIQNDIRVEFEEIDGDSTSYRVIVNGQPMKQAIRPDDGGSFAYFDQKYSDLSQKEQMLLLEKLEKNGIPRELFLTSLESNTGESYPLNVSIRESNKKAFEHGSSYLANPREPQIAMDKQIAFERDFMEKDLGRPAEKYQQDAKIISHIKNALAEKGISNTYFSEINQSPTAQIDRDIKRTETELAKEQIRQDHYVKSGKSEIAVEHKREVIDYLKDKVNDARESRDKIIASGTVIQPISNSNSQAGKEMMIAAASMPKAFQLNGQGKAFDDAFQPKAFSPVARTASQEQDKATQKQVEQPKSPKISFDR